MIRRDSPGAPRPPSGALRATVWVALVAVSGVSTRAWADATPSPAAPTAAADPNPAVPLDPMQRLGSISVGLPHTGVLVNGVKMPKDDAWILSIPDHAWGTDETVESLAHALRRVAAQFPGGPKAILGSLSAEHGGPLPPHKSHRTGRDADVHVYLTERDPRRYYQPATADNLDRPRCWAFLRTLITETDVEMILVDQSIQDLLLEYALSIGEDPAWLDDIFRGSGRPYGDLIKHVPGHTGHFHVRFVSPYSRRRGVEMYDRLVEQGRLEPPSRELSHTVAPGDTLIGIGRRYGVSASQIRAANALDSSLIKVGQVLRVQEPVDIPGARDPVRVPARRLPPPTGPATAGGADDRQRPGDSPNRSATRATVSPVATGNDQRKASPRTQLASEG